MRPVLLALCAAALAGCAGTAEPEDDRPAVSGAAAAAARTPAAGSDVSRAAFLPDPGVNYEALISGVLRGDEASGCLWLEAAGGEGRVSRQTPLLVYDDEARVDFGVQPAGVRTRDGRLLVRLGEPVELGGGYRPADTVQAVPDCPATGSQVFVSSRFPR